MKYFFPFISLWFMWLGMMTCVGTVVTYVLWSFQNWSLDPSIWILPCRQEYGDALGRFIVISVVLTFIAALILTEESKTGSKK